VIAEEVEAGTKTVSKMTEGEGLSPLSFCI